MRWQTVFSPWRWRWWVKAAVLTVLFSPALYIASQAPLLRLDRRSGGVLKQYTGVSVQRWKFYQPADWVYDHTALRTPLLKWANLWSVGIEVEGRRGLRQNAMLDAEIVVKE